MKLNKAGMMGFFLCFMAIIFGVATNGGLSSIVDYLHLPSFILTAGGALCAVLTTADSFEDFAYGAKGLLVAFKNNEVDAGQLTQTILQMSDTARKEGLLSLEDIMYIPLQMNHLHGLYEPASRRMRTTLTETAPTYYFVSFQVYT